MKRICFILAFFQFVFTGLCFSNDAPLRSVGKTIQPLKDVQVRMVSEDVSINLENNRVYVECVFELLNEGQPDTIDVGFPRGWEEDLCGFTAFIGQKRLEVKDVTSEPFDGEWNGEKMPWWKVFRVPFVKTGETVKVINRYWTPFMINGHIGFEDYSFTYITKTGAFWKGGKIDKADFTLRIMNFNPGQLTKISPEGYKYESERLIKWSYRDFVPTQNIELRVMQDMVFDRKANAERILAKNPDDPFAHFLLGTVFFSMRYQGDKINVPSEDKAVEEFNKAIALDPGKFRRHVGFWRIVMHA